MRVDFLFLYRVACGGESAFKTITHSLILMRAVFRVKEQHKSASQFACVYQTPLAEILCKKILRSHDMDMISKVALLCKKYDEKLNPLKKLLYNQMIDHVILLLLAYSVSAVP